MSRVVLFQVQPKEESQVSEVEDFKRFSHMLIHCQKERIEFLHKLKHEVAALLEDYQREMERMVALLEEFLYLNRTEREKAVEQFLQEQQAIREEINKIWCHTMEILESHKC